MPNYMIQDKKTKEQLGIMSMTISEMETFEKKNPKLEVGVAMPLIHSGRGLQKPDASFRDLLKHIKKGNSKGIKGSTINDF